MTVIPRNPTQFFHIKPTDTHRDLYYASAHQKSCTHKGPFGQFLRVRLIYHQDDDSIVECENMKHHYLVRSYPGREEAQDEALNGKPIDPQITQSSKSGKLTIITHFHPDNPDLREIIN